MADTVAHETENTENQQNDANVGDTADLVKKPDVAEPAADETGDSTENNDHSEGTHKESLKRKSECGVTEDGTDDAKKAKTDDDSPEAQTNSDDDKPEQTTKTVEDVHRLAGEGDEEVAA